jgi:hypothetical protein
MTRSVRGRGSESRGDMWCIRWRTSISIASQAKRYRFLTFALTILGRCQEDCGGTVGGMVIGKVRDGELIGRGVGSRSVQREFG